MKGWIKQMVLGLLAPLLLTLMPAHATGFDTKGCWEVGGTWIYWKPCARSFIFAQEAIGGLPIRSVSVRPGYASGFRAQLGWQSCNRNTWAVARYTYWDAVGHGQINGRAYSYFPSDSLRFIKALRKFEYQTGEVYGGIMVYNECGKSAYVLGGVRYVYLEEFLSMTLVGVVKNFESSRFSGGALQFGFGGEWSICYGFGLVGEFRGLLGIGDKKLASRNFSGQSPSWPTELSCFPGVDAKLGINYTWACACFVFEGAVGYEINHLWSVARRVLPQGVVIGFDVSVPISHSVGFHGPYVNVKARF